MGFKEPNHTKHTVTDSTVRLMKICKLTKKKDTRLKIVKLQLNMWPLPGQKAPNKWSRAGHHPSLQRGTQMRRGPSATTQTVTSDSVLPQGTLSLGFTLGMLREKSLKRKKKWLKPQHFPLCGEKNKPTQFLPYLPLPMTLSKLLATQCVSVPWFTQLWKSNDNNTSLLHRGDVRDN